MAERGRGEALGEGNGAREGAARSSAGSCELFEIHHITQVDDLTSLQTSLAALFNSVVLPFFLSSPTPPSPSPPPTLPQFLHAYSIVSSRAFQVDSWHSLSLVPFADIFNHTDDHDVHLESEHWVCPECGALDACEHDDADESDAPTSGQLVEDDPCEMVTVEGISAGQEVFNTYGELSNAQLLAFYGFALEANKYDRITFAFDDVARLAPSPPPSSTIAEEWASLNKLWHSAEREDEAQEEGLEEDTLVVDGSSGHLYIDADARLSSSLWLLLLRLHIPLPAASPNRLTFLRSLRRAQVRIASGEEENLGEDLDSLEERALRVLAEAVRSLCAARLAGQEEAHRTGGELLEMASVSSTLASLVISRLIFSLTGDDRHSTSAGAGAVGERAHLARVRPADMVFVVRRSIRVDKTCKVARCSHVLSWLDEAYERRLQFHRGYQHRHEERVTTSTQKRRTLKEEVGGIK